MVRQKMKNQFEIYREEFGKRKTYIVTKIDEDYETVISYAKKYFHCSEKHIEFVSGWLYKGDLYLEDPLKKNVKTVGVAYYV